MDELFVTLDPTTRRLSLPDGSPVLITDTVGFIRKLPPAIVTAFRATLEELAEASILLHVVDLSAPDAAGQCQTVENILTDLNLRDKPRITALNKIDRLLGNGKAWNETEAIDYLSRQQGPMSEDTVLISAGKKWGLTRLLSLISHLLSKTASPV